jgi:glucokinase
LEAEEWGYKEAVQAGWTGHAAAAGLLDELFLHWSAGIVNLVHAYDPECVILSGGLMKSARDVLPRLEETVRRRAWTDWGEIRFKAADNPDASVLLGLAALLNGSDKKEAAR